MFHFATPRGKQNPVDFPAFFRKSVWEHAFSSPGDETHKRIAALAARILLGLLFLVFGLNGFIGFIHQPPPPPGVAGQYLGAIVASHMYLAASAVEVVTTLMFLSGFFVPLGLVLLGPVLGTILLFHILMAPAGIAPGLVAFLLWLVVFWSVRDSFAGIFRARA